MSKRFGNLSAAFAILAAGACGEQRSPDNTAPESASEPSTSAHVAAGDAYEGAELGSNAVPGEGATAPADDLGAAPRKEGSRQEGFDARNSAFTLDGSTVALKNGSAEAPAAPGSQSLVTTRYFGKEASGDLNGDGRDDVAYFVTRDGIGSGRFTYVVAAINGMSGYKTTNAFLVGDRIVPQSLRISANELHVNFAGREKSEPMTAPPTHPSVLLLKVTPQGVLKGLMK